MFIRILDRLGRVLGYLPFTAMLKIMGAASKGIPLPPARCPRPPRRARRDVLVAELRKNDPRVVRIRCYLQYLDRHGSVASRLCQAGVPRGHTKRTSQRLSTQRRQPLGEHVSVSCADRARPAAGSGRSRRRARPKSLGGHGP